MLGAARLIQRVLGTASSSASSAPAPGTSETAPRAFNPTAALGPSEAVMDVPFRDLPAEPANEMRFQASPDESETPPAAEARESASDTQAAPATVAREAFADRSPVTAPAPGVEPEPDAGPFVQPAAPLVKPRPASFRANRFSFEGTDYAYRLYLPPGLVADVASGPARPLMADAADAPLAPALIVLLHGCKQDAADFAKGTDMNALAEVEGCLVLYPEQLTKANSMRCWNWFDPAHQSRESGEPGMIAALTRKVMAQHGVDDSRVYVAGLSAGGAMAAVLASEYPDLFAAAGIHSGLPQGAAKDVMSAFSAMRSGPASRGARLKSATSGAAVPTPVIVFHGSADKTVNPDNGAYIVEAALQAFAASGLRLTETRTNLLDAGDSSGSAEGSGERTGERSLFSAADGTAYVESWEIAAGPHAWSGGHAGGSYTDPDGPSASAAMLAFFLQHRRKLH